MSHASTHPLLIELLTEELPPKALWKLASAFAEALLQQLKQHEYSPETAKVQVFATPRRLAARIDSVHARQPDSIVRRKGPAVSSGLSAEGQPTPALLGFLKSCNATLTQLTQEQQQGHHYFFFEAQHQGQPLTTLLKDIVEHAIKKLPIPKTMRWGDRSDNFVRPVKSIIALHGDEVVPLTLFGHQSGRLTQGHRLLAKVSPISIPTASAYESLLQEQGAVIADYQTRRQSIVDALIAEQKADEQMVMPDSLIDEVCGLVECPVVLRADFDAHFLSVPKEVLILSMQTHQRYFAIENKAGQLTSSFLLVSNIQTDDPSSIIEGNRRVLRARLSDARFFFEQDKKTPLSERVKHLGNVIYHKKLGSQAERVQRVKKLAQLIYAPFRQAWLLGEQRLDETIDLSKADLLSDMVGEFPELQGVIGSYYAENQGCHPNVVLAIREQYQLKFDTLTLATEQRERALLSVILRVADRLETLVGLYGIGLAPTGDKDPFALRRCAFVILDALEWLCQESRAGRLAPLKLPAVKTWINHAWSVFPEGLLTVDRREVFDFILERTRQRLAQTFPRNVIDAVLSSPAPVAEAPIRIEALSRRAEHPAVQALAHAHKRVQNLLKKTDHSTLVAVDPAHFQGAAEQALWDALQSHKPNCESLLSTLHIDGAIDTLAELAEPVERFFAEVMVMADNPAIRNNRLALLAALDHLISSIAQLSALA